MISDFTKKSLIFGMKRGIDHLQSDKFYYKNYLKYLLLFYFIVMLISIGQDVTAYAGKVCGSTSPCQCGTNCSADGGNELFGNSRDYCEANPIECFNTIDNCEDGIYDNFNYVVDVKVSSLNDTVFRIGDVVEVNATVYSSSSSWEGVFIVYANQSANTSVNWTVKFSGGFGAISTTSFYVNLTLDKIVGDHSIRVVDEYNQYDNITCGTGLGSDWPAYSDTDDITFQVEPQLTPSISFISPTPENTTIMKTTTVVINVSHIERTPDSLILNWNGTNQTPIRYSGNFTNITMSELTQGNYTFYVWVNDTFGNINWTETRQIQIIAPFNISIENPLDGDGFTTPNISLIVSVKSLLQNTTVTGVSYSLNANQNLTINKLNITS
jgi:hypothetical protein